MSTAGSYQVEAPELEVVHAQPAVTVGGLLRQHPRIVAALSLLALLALVSLLAPWISPHNPLAVDPDSARLAPGPGHLMGTDELGRDVLSRVIWGGRVSLPVAFVAVGVGLVAGSTLGLISGYRGAITDLVLMRVVDAIQAFPALLLAIALVAALGPKLINVMIAIGVVQVPIYARLTRAQVLQTKNLEFMTAARSLGASPARLIARHLLPNMVNPIIVQVSLSAAFAILAEAALSFLGLSVQPPTPDWGYMINTGARFLSNSVWWMTVGPAVGICLAVFGFNWLGDALRDALDPRLRR